MQENNRKKEVLLYFLDKKVFDPVMEAVPDLYSSQRDRRMLQSVQEKVRSEREWFHKPLLTAEEIKDQYFREIYFEGRGNLGKVLEDLELPRFVQLRSQFVDLCEDLKI